MIKETDTLVIRQTFLDREKEIPADLTIKCLNTDITPSFLTPQLVEAGLKSTSTLVAGASLLFAKWAKDFQKHANELPMFDPAVSNSAGGDPNIIYYHSYWALKPDEALVIEAMPPECQHWNFQLNNYWMESLDYSNYQIHTNKYLATYRSDGSVRIIVAHQNPELPNWINTVGHECGTMCFRWIKAKTHPQPTTRVVKHSDLASLK